MSVEGLLVVVVVLVAFGALGGLLLKGYSRALVGDIVLSVSKERVAMGEKLTYVLELQPSGRLRVNDIRVTCHGYEWIQWRETESYTDSNGKSQTRTVTRTATHTLHEKRHRFASDSVLKKDEAFEREGTFTIPAAGPPSFSASDNAVHWRLRVDVDIPDLPDVSETFDFEVRPVVHLRS